MQKISASLEAIARVVEKNADISETERAIKATRDLIKGAATSATKAPADGHELPYLKELDAELATWQTKLSVILKEPVGKKGMAKHARFWAEKLSGARVK